MKKYLQSRAWYRFSLLHPALVKKTQRQPVIRRYVEGLVHKKGLSPGTPAKPRKWGVEGPRLAQIRFVVICKRSLNKKGLSPGTLAKPRKWGLAEPMLAKIGFVFLFKKGLIRNSYRQARQANLETDGWKGPGLAKILIDREFLSIFEKITPNPGFNMDLEFYTSPWSQGPSVNQSSADMLEWSQRASANQSSTDMLKVYLNKKGLSPDTPAKPRKWGVEGPRLA